MVHGIYNVKFKVILQYKIFGKKYSAFVGLSVVS
jgi:hypothetical protein